MRTATGLPPAAELIRERDVLLKALADAAEDWARLRQERDRLKGQLLQAENTIATLRAKGKQAVADRDRWEALARQRASQLVELREGTGCNNKFRQVKAFIGKKLHPDGGRAAGHVEQIARLLLFKEIWPEIVRIDRGAH